MATWESQQPSTSTPLVKFEDSPAESFISTPGDMYPSLFDAATPAVATMNPMEAMTPQSALGDEKNAETFAGTSASPEPSEKKQAKKRKSWGQVLPEPKTNLPPRKRAKTEDEKEQRRVERVLRNRRAAQSSRERKRQEVEALEKRNQDLLDTIQKQQQMMMAMSQQLRDLQRGAGVVGRSASPPSFQPSPITLSQPLFASSNDADLKANPGLMDDFILMPESNATVNPASLTPELNPVADSAIPSTSTSSAPAKAAPAKASSTSSAPATDMTQHPAAVLCDLQCQSVVSEPEQSESTASRQQPALALALFLQFQLMLTISSEMLSVCTRRPLMLIAGALKANLALHPTPSTLNTIIWMVTLPDSYRTSTSTTSSTTAATTTTRASFPSTVTTSTTLRIRSLQKILTCSPNLARPLMDATMDLLRLVSNGERDDRAVVGGVAVGGGKEELVDPGRQPQPWINGASLPSKEVLLTLMWALKVEERKLRTTKGPGSSVHLSTPSSKLLKQKYDVFSIRKGAARHSKDVRCSRSSVNGRQGKRSSHLRF